MPDKPLSTQDSLDLVCVSQSLDPHFEKKLKKENWNCEVIEAQDLVDIFEIKDIKAILLDTGDLPFHFISDRVSPLQKKYPKTLWFIQSPQLEPQVIDQITAKMSVYGILQHPEELEDILPRAMEHYQDRKQYFQVLGKVKEQNKKLEGLNNNLEKIIHERTLNEFVANQRTTESLKIIQGHLSFVKMMSRVNNLEEFMHEVWRGFKKVNGLMAPMLILEDENLDKNLFYFQGKQLIEKELEKKEGSKKIDIEDRSGLQKSLTDILGRPIGSLYVESFSFRSKELRDIQALLIFENSLSAENKEQYEKYRVDRWPIANMAIENILIKENMQKTAKQWSQTFNEMKDPILIIDSHFNMSLSNGEFRRQAESFGFHAFVDSNRKKEAGPIQKTFSSGEPHNGDIKVGGTIFRIHSYPIRMDGQDRVSHVINQYVDVTQSIDLQSRVIQGEKMAAVGLLAGNIAHELNNPLTGIFSLAQLLLDDFEKESNTYKDMVEVKNAAERCQRIIRDLIEFSDVESDSRVKKVEVNALVRKTLPLLKVAMRMMNLDMQLEEKELWVECNPQLLQQVIFNLVNNACQAMDEGGLLKVQTHLQDTQVVLSIRDTGSGIPDSIQDAIFDPFFTTKSQGKGTGLGLSMSKSVIERNGGRLELIESNENGTEFQVLLPLGS